ncbi:MAG: DUF5916 domain-containing protein [Gemmatimonadaceae bacterium]
MHRLVPPLVATPFAAVPAARFLTALLTTVVALAGMLVACVAPRALAAQRADSAVRADTSARDLAARDRSAPPKGMRAGHVAGRPIAIDGRLDEPAWARGAWVSGFLQRDPMEGAPASEVTEVAILYDEDALYVGARMRSAHPAAIRALVDRRDREGSSEQFIVSLDTYHDRRTAYTFAVTAAGVRVDYYHSADDINRRDYSFNPVWEAETALDSAGWTAELRIPFTQLRFTTRGAQTWGINLVRRTPAHNETAYWVLIPKTQRTWSSQFGELTGIEGIRPSRRAEIVPYVAGDATLTARPEPGNPFEARSASGLRTGGDIKVGLGPSLTLDATVNPDFGQVEADPAEVNLSAFETFFSERRPFFVEGSQLLSAAGPGWFYSRRIGAPPRGSPDADYVEELHNSTILGAAKVTGQLPRGLSVGVMAAVTDREQQRTFDSAFVEVDDEETDSTFVPAAFRRVPVEPRTGYGVVRLQQQFGENASTAGIILTGVHRALRPGDIAAEILTRDAVSGATDLRLRWKDGEYDWSSFAGFSHVAGSEEAIAGLQASSRRYYQRPDASYVHFDPRRTTLSGFSAGTGVSKLEGNWRWDLDLGSDSPGFELNDAGRLGTADNINASGRIVYEETRPGAFHDWTVSVNSSHSWNYGGVRTSSYAEVNADAKLRNFWGVSGEVWLQPSALSDNLTRGGPLMGTARRWGGSVNAEGPPGGKTRLEADVSGARDELGGWETSASLGLRVRPGTRLELSLDPEVSRSVNARQFIGSRARLAGSTETFGRRYLFSFIERSELSARLRLNYALTPDLTLESYAEPFAASGRYYDVGELGAPRSLDLRTYGTAGTGVVRGADGSLLVTDTLPGGVVDAFTLGNRDFNVRSFRSNLVLRWEWRPGSTLFLVWQQDRSADDTNGRLVRPRALRDSFSAPGDNFFAVKATYWIGLR